MKKYVIIAVVVLVALAGLMFGRDKGISYFSKQTAVSEKQGKFDQAINSFNKVVLFESLVPFNKRRSDAYVYRGRLYFNAGNTEKALEDLDTALRINKDNAEASFGIALIRLQEGDLKLALKELDRVIKLRPKWVEAYLSRQVAYRKLGEKDKAIKDLKKVIEIEPKNAAATQALKMIE